MDDFFEFMQTLIIRGVIAIILYFVFGMAWLVIFGDHTQAPAIVSIIVLVVIVVLATKIEEKFSKRR